MPEVLVEVSTPHKKIKDYLESSNKNLDLEKCENKLLLLVETVLKKVKASHGNIHCIRRGNKPHCTRLQYA